MINYLYRVFYRLLIRPLFFLFDPEDIHYFVFRFIKFSFKIPGIAFIVRKIYCSSDERLLVTKMGLSFSNPIGLAAGFDKDALLFSELSAFGFSFVEIGTLTPLPQSGNEKPRMFRLPKSKALINRMGFNNKGVKEAAARLRTRSENVIIGGNIGKNKATPNEDAINDYLICFEELFDVVDYFAINVSSPNTPGLRDLQEKEPLTALLNAVQAINFSKPKPKPILLKIAPDLSNQQIEEVIEIVKSAKLAGIIATNTTIGREGIANDANKLEIGGLSGFPLKDKSTAVIRFIREKAGKELLIIGVGGIFTAADAVEKLEAGADLLQVYTGFIYEGPSLVSRICSGLVARR